MMDIKCVLIFKKINSQTQFLRFTSFAFVNPFGVFFEYRKHFSPDFGNLLLAADKEKELEAQLRDRITGGIDSQNGECLMRLRVSAEQAMLWDAQDDIYKKL
jgi:hypothetical protein